MLDAKNSSYEPQTFSLNKVEILGVIVGYFIDAQEKQTKAMRARLAGADAV